ncbi:MAG: CHASE domain-containing protein, partial [Aurantimonas coralicida]
MRKHLVPAAILVVSCAFALALAALVWRSSTESDRLRFESFADDAVGRIESRLDLHVSLLESTRAYMGAANAGRDRDSFAAFVGELDLDGRYDGIQGIGFADAIAVAQTGETASTIAASYGLDRGVWPEETDQPARTPILLLEPQ